MQKHKIVIAAPEEMTGQDVVLAIQSVLEYVVEDLREMAKNAGSDDNRFLEQAKYYEQFEVCDE